jgi:hypothetical protein
MQEGLPADAAGGLTHFASSVQGTLRASSMSQATHLIDKKRSNAVVTAMMRLCDMLMQRASESPLTRLTVNQAAGVAVNAVFD